MSPPERDSALLAALPRLPRDHDGPVFAEPWQAEVFALVVALHARGVFSWDAWTHALGAELARDPDDDGSRYYVHWLAALEGLLASQGLAEPGTLEALRRAWADAYRSTPHGQPVITPKSV